MNWLEQIEIINRKLNGLLALSKRNVELLETELDARPLEKDVPEKVTARNSTTSGTIEPEVWMMFLQRPFLVQLTENDNPLPRLRAKPETNMESNMDKNESIEVRPCQNGYVVEYSYRLARDGKDGEFDYKYMSEKYIFTDWNDVVKYVSEKKLEVPAKQ